MLSKTSLLSFKSAIPALALVLLCFSLHAQTSTSSPYSRFGLGDLQFSGFSSSYGMGGVSYGYQNDSLAPFYINNANPASHHSVRLTTFELGLMNNLVQMETANEKFVANRTALSYFSIGFPVKKWWGMTVGINPYSNVGYKAGYSEERDSIGTVNYVYEGNGGVNELYWGNGFSYKNFAIGLNAAYLFGRSNYISRDSFPSAGNFFSTKVTRSTDYSDFYFKLGLQYKTRLFKNKWSLSLGLSYSMESDLHARYTLLAETYKYTFVEFIRDTALYAPDSSIHVTLPMMLGAGFVLRNDKWMLGADFSMQDWSRFSAFGQAGYLTNSNRVSIGMQYTPDRLADKGSYFKRMNYRLGGRYANTHLLLASDQQITDMAVSFGFGMPLRKLKVGETYNQSMLNISFELGQRGTIENDLIRERYFRVVLSLTLNERWFIQRKYD
ncbi:MAG: hypothetical protein AB1458_06320 [Bacteroidota bacterium]